MTPAPSPAVSRPGQPAPLRIVEVSAKQHGAYVEITAVLSSGERRPFFWHDPTCRVDLSTLPGMTMREASENLVTAILTGGADKGESLGTI